MCSYSSWMKLYGPDNDDDDDDVIGGPRARVARSFAQRHREPDGWLCAIVSSRVLLNISGWKFLSSFKTFTIHSGRKTSPRGATFILNIARCRFFDDSTYYMRAKEVDQPISLSRAHTRPRGILCDTHRAIRGTLFYECGSREGNLSRGVTLGAKVCCCVCDRWENAARDKCAKAARLMRRESLVLAYDIVYWYSRAFFYGKIIPEVQPCTRVTAKSCRIPACILSDIIASMGHRNLRQGCRMRESLHAS